MSGSSSGGGPVGDEDDGLYYEARYDYEAAQPGDLNFSVGDNLVVTGPRAGSWWLATNMRTGQRGYIPSNYVNSRASTRQKTSTASSSSSSSSTSSTTTTTTGLTRRVRAIKDYTSLLPSRLSFTQHQKIELIGQEEGGWVRGRLLGSTGDDAEGLVPLDCVTEDPSLLGHEWYMGRMSREEAETLLNATENRLDGTYLVRDSTQATSGYTISVFSRSEVRHYMIHVDGDGCMYLNKSLPFPTLPALLAHHSIYPVLSTTLTNPAKQKESTADVRGENPWEIERGCVVTGEILGQGQFGEVYKAKWNNSIDVAVKVLKDDCMRRMEIVQEGATMQRLRHPRLVKLYGIVNKPTDQPLLLVTELVPRGTLLKHLRHLNEKGHPHSLGLLVKMSAQVASGMAYLEGEKVIHRDLAARNILVANNLDVKIADFGLARFIKGEFYLRQSTKEFPVKWTAPESIIHSIYTSKSDVWSFGILLYEIFTHGGLPYPGVSNKEASELIRAGEVNQCPPGCPSQVFALMMQCWRHNPSQRPVFASLHQILGHWTKEWQAGRLSWVEK